MDAVTFAAQYMKKYGMLIRNRYFGGAAWQDWEDFTQDVLLYVCRSTTLTTKNGGWKGWIANLVNSRAKNWLRDARLRASKRVRLTGDMDVYIDEALPVDRMYDVNEVVAAFAPATQRFAQTTSYLEATKSTPGQRRGSLTARYQRVRQQVEVDHYRFREALYATA